MKVHTGMNAGKDEYFLSIDKSGNRYSNKNNQCAASSKH